MIRIKVKRKQPLRLKKRLRNKARLRKKIAGDEKRPRLSVFRSGQHIYAQLIDDENGKTLAASSSLKFTKKGTKKEIAKLVGENIAELASKKKIQNAVFDRGGFIYHGRLKSLAEGARSGGLKF